MLALNHWINGREVPFDAEATTITVSNPATGETIATGADATQAQVDEAIASAREAQVEWAETSLAVRSRVMYTMRQLLIEHADELAEIIVREGGKTHGDGLGEIARGRETVEFATSVAAHLRGGFTTQAATGIDVHTLRQPVGVVAGICPFNFPIMVPMWMHPLALAAGNAFVLKPASPVPSASLAIAKLYQEAGLPDGLFQVVLGDQPVVEQLLNHPGIDAISFVGSTRVARIVSSTGTAAGKRVQALGGANNHAIVMPDADLDFAAKQVASGAFGAAGQRCMALPLAVVVGDVADDFIARVAARADELVVGAGTDPASELGPVISAKALERITGLVADAESRGAVLVRDGRGFTPDDPKLADGFWLGPTIVDKLPTDSPLYEQEVFGPVLGIVRAESYEEAIRIMNASPYGNGAAIFTSDGGTAREFTRQAQAGMVGVNIPIPVPVGYYSFGGWKDSLLGDVKIHGPQGLSFYTKEKVVTTRWPSGQQAQASLNFVETK